MSKMNHDIVFFKDEIREGFYIPTAIKQLWGASLDVLSEIDRICRKHNICYFAEWGTFLGAVRHKGFIPWDDDLDIGMKREDYIRFREIADKELPKEYVIHDYERKEDFWELSAKVVNSEHICFDIDHLKKNYNFPWLACVDIFIADYLYKEPDKEKARDKEVLRMIALADAVLNGGYRKETLISEIQRIKEKYGIILPDTKNKREISVMVYKLAEKIMAEVPEEEADKIGAIYPHIILGKTGEDKEDYNNIAYVPFEDTFIPILENYEKALPYRYGNWKILYKNGASHNYPFFEAQKKDLIETTGAKLKEFVFDSKYLKRKPINKENSYKEMISKCLKILSDDALWLDSNKALIKEDEMIQKLEEDQQLAIEIGELIEQIRGESDEHTLIAVKVLEEYCEQLYNFMNVDDFRLSDGEKTVERTIKKEIINRKEVLFLPLGKKEWSGFESIYEFYKTKDDTDILIVPLPLAKKDPLGNAKVSEEKQILEQMDQYRSLDIEIINWRDYNLEIHSPDVIVFQNPYDGNNPYLTVPQEYYSDNLQKNTEMLIYHPIGKTAEFGPDDYSDQYNMNHYVTAPGVISADFVVVQSDNIKEQYINKLTGFSGEGYRSDWEKKVITEQEWLERNT